ncbi:MAG: hypothetical protein RL135_1788 [Bacteroidota bacterium]|jgi:hypothetical protein
MNAVTSNKNAPIYTWGIFNNWIDLKWLTHKVIYFDPPPPL